MIRNGSRLVAPEGSFRTMINCSFENAGRLEQSPYFRQYNISGSWSAGTYYNAGSQTEPSTIPSHLILDLNGVSIIHANTYTFRVLGTQQQIVRQDTQPAGITLYTQCLAIINSFTGLALALNDTLDVEMTAAAAFRWRKSGGGWTAGVPSTAGVSIDSGNVTLYFQAATGFAGTEAWSWRRTDWMAESAVTTAYTAPYVLIGNLVYFLDASNRLMMYDISLVNGGVQSAGYRKIQGRDLCVFQNHLFVTNFNVTGSNYTAITVACSDLNNFHNFFATDTNEADSFTINDSEVPGGTLRSNDYAYLSAFNDILYLYSPRFVWFTGYAGLPNPFNFRRLVPFPRGTVTIPPISSKDGDYITCGDTIFLFNGASFTDITTEKMSEVTTTPLWGGYDSFRREVYFMYPSGTFSDIAQDCWLVFQEKTREWYLRYCSFAQRPRALATSIDGYLISGIALKLIQEDLIGSNAIIPDQTAGATVSVPLLETQDLCPAPMFVVETDTAWLDSYYSSPAHADYSPTGVRISVATRELVGATVTYSITSDWTTAQFEQNSIRTAGRIFRFKVIPLTTSTAKGTFGFVLHSLTILMHNLPRPPRDMVER